MKEENEHIVDDFTDDKKIMMSFNLQGQHERNKLEEIAKAHSLDKSAMIRQLILKEWRRIKNGTADV